jgi:hypothetical protein
MPTPPRPSTSRAAPALGVGAGLILVDRDSLICPEDDLHTTEGLWPRVGGKVVFEGR